MNNFGLVVLKKNQGSMKKRNRKRSTTIKPSQQDSRTLGTKGSLVQGGSQIRQKTFQKCNASTVESMDTTRIIVPSQRKGRKNMKHQLSKKRNLQRRLSRMEDTSSSKKVTTLFLFLIHILFASSLYISCCIVFVRILYIYLLEDNVFQEELYLWKNNKIRMNIIR